MDKKTLVTVTCTRDKWFMVLQAFSLDKFVSGISNHYVIIEDLETTFDEWKTLLDPYYTKHNLIIITKDTTPELYPKCEYQENMQGWQRQQLLKLGIARVIKSDCYINLDSKDIFVKHYDLSSINREGNNWIININESDHLGGFRNWISVVSEYTGKPIPKNFWLYQSPFLFKTKTVRKILKTIDIENLFLKVHNYQSEYLLYRFYSDRAEPAEFPRSQRFMIPEDYGHIVSLYEKYSHPETFIFSVHRKSFSYNTEIISDFLISINFDKSIVEKAIQTAAYWHT